MNVISWQPFGIFDKPIYIQGVRSLCAQQSFVKRLNNYRGLLELLVSETSYAPNEVKKYIKSVFGAGSPEYKQAKTTEVITFYINWTLCMMMH